MLNEPRFFQLPFSSWNHLYPEMVVTDLESDVVGFNVDVDALLPFKSKLSMVGAFRPVVYVDAALILMVRVAPFETVTV